MAWTNLTFSFGSLLTSTKVTQLYDNFTAMAQGMTGAPGIYETAVDWANAGGISQLQILETEISSTTSIATVFSTQLYIPLNANSLEYVVQHKGTTNSADVRLTTNTNNGTTLQTSSTTYVFSSAGTLNISDKSGWTTINVQLGVSAGTGYVNRVICRFK